MFGIKTRSRLSSGLQKSHVDQWVVSFRRVLKACAIEAGEYVEGNHADFAPPPSRVQIRRDVQYLSRPLHKHIRGLKEATRQDIRVALEWLEPNDDCCVALRKLATQASASLLKDIQDAVTTKIEFLVSMKGENNWAAPVEFESTAVRESLSRLETAIHDLSERVNAARDVLSADIPPVNSGSGERVVVDLRQSGPHSVLLVNGSNQVVEAYLASGSNESSTPPAGDRKVTTTSKNTLSVGVTGQPDADVVGATYVTDMTRYGKRKLPDGTFPSNEMGIHSVPVKRVDQKPFKPTTGRWRRKAAEKGVTLPRGMLEVKANSNPIKRGVAKVVTAVGLRNRVVQPMAAPALGQPHDGVCVWTSSTGAESVRVFANRIKKESGKSAKVVIVRS